MPAYMISLAKIHDRDKLMADYVPAAAELIAKNGGEYLIRGAGAQLLEGTLDGYESVVVSRWPNIQTAKDHYHSDAYMEIKKTRAGLADIEILVIETPDS